MSDYETPESWDEDYRKLWVWKQEAQDKIQVLRRASAQSQLDLEQANDKITAMGIVRDNRIKQLSKADKDIQELKDGFKFAYENGTFYPKAFDYLDPIYEKHLKDKQ